LSTTKEKVMKYVLLITTMAFIAVFVAAATWLPDPLRYMAGPHRGEVCASGFGVAGFAFYLAALVAGFAVFMPAVCIHERLAERRNQE
jgi:hypothetical protein